MLRTIFLGLFFIWLLGLIGGYTMGSFSQVLLIAPLFVLLMAPLIILVYQIITGRRAQH